MKANDLAARLVELLNAQILDLNCRLQELFAAIERWFECSGVLESLNERAFEALTRRRLCESFRDLLLAPISVSPW